MRYSGGFSVFSALQVQQVLYFVYNNVIYDLWQIESATQTSRDGLLCLRRSVPLLKGYREPSHNQTQGMQMQAIAFPVPCVYVKLDASKQTFQTLGYRGVTMIL